MRRLLFLICAVVLLLDLADDGCLGKVKFVAPQHAAQYSVASSNHNSGKVECRVVLTSENLRDLPRQFSDQPVGLGMVLCHPLNDFCFPGGSGGIPL